MTSNQPSYSRKLFPLLVAPALTEADTKVISILSLSAFYGFALVLLLLMMFHARARFFFSICLRSFGWRLKMGKYSNLSWRCGCVGVCASCHPQPLVPGTNTDAAQESRRRKTDGKIRWKIMLGFPLSRCACAGGMMM